MKTKRYDRAYFDKWYRHPKHRIGAAVDLDREVAFAVALAERVLERPIESVLDVGAGEGRWFPVLQRLRPGTRYAGIEPSEWAVKRWGKRRNLRLGDFSTLDALGVDEAFDLVVCADVLHYLPTTTLRAGLPGIAERTGGVAWLPLLTAEDEVAGDLVGFQRRRARTYLGLFNAAGLHPLGMHGYVTAQRWESLAALEQ